MTFFLGALLAAVLVALVAAKGPPTSWSCEQVQDDQLLAKTSAFWRKENCTAGNDAYFIIHSLHVDLTSKDVRVLPGYSMDASQPLLPINKMAATYGPDAKLIAGINGGYFWRTDITGFWVDDVCRGKLRSDANKPVDSCEQHPNNGLHDGSLIVDGKVVGCNCDKWGYSRPALLATPGDSADWSVKVLERGQQADASVKMALAAGPNLVSYDPATGAARIDIPSGEDNINRFEHAAQTAVGLNFAPQAEGGKATKMVLVTSDGRECLEDKSCGLSDPYLASLMLYHFNAQSALSMDQGGSTTAWVAGAPNDGIVSNAGGGARAVANGLFIQAL